MLNTQLK